MSYSICCCTCDPLLPLLPEDGSAATALTGAPPRKTTLVLPSPTKLTLTQGATPVALVAAARARHWRLWLLLGRSKFDKVSSLVNCDVMAMHHRFPAAACEQTLLLPLANRNTESIVANSLSIL